MSEEKEFTDMEIVLAKLDNVQGRASDIYEYNVSIRRVLESIENQHQKDSVDLKTLQKLHEKMLDDYGELSDIHQKDRELLERAMWKLRDLCYMDEDEQRQTDKMIDKIKQHLQSSDKVGDKE